MAQSSIPVLTCDRCGYEVEVRDTALDRGWGRTFSIETKPVETGDRPRRIGESDAGADMCPGCLTALIEWWAAPKAPAEQPLPLPPVARVRPSFTIEDRRIAVGIVAEALAAQSDAVVDAMREAPTQFLVDGEQRKFAVHLFEIPADDIIGRVAEALNTKPA